MNLLLSLPQNSGAALPILALLQSGLGLPNALQSMNMPAQSSQFSIPPPMRLAQAQTVAAAQPQEIGVPGSAQKTPALTNRKPVLLFLEYDEHNLTEYQRLIRQNVELFEAGPEEVRGSAQGRNIPILLGQVGIRCRHCAMLPFNARARGAVYFTRTIDGLYQVAQSTFLKSF
jgi:hypothetical protein